MHKFWIKTIRLPRHLWRTIWKVGREDPRRVIHSLKVGLSLTLVALLYLLEPLFQGIGENAIWAVMTVVVVLEFTVGATLCKGLNRGIGTISAGALAYFIEYFAHESGQVFQAILIGVAVFLIGTAAAYVRFIPYIRKHYDYGVLIFLLTFNLITVSSYRVHNVLKLAHERFYTIAIGVAICLVMSLLIFPTWSGEYLHASTISNLESLARSTQACVAEYFENEGSAVEETLSEDPIYKCYKKILDSKSHEETLALHASWEPWHSRRCYRYPWQQYVKLGAVLRHFGYTAVALHGCLQSEIQTPRLVRALFRNPCIHVAEEVSKVLMELADSIRNKRRCSPDVLSDNLNDALQELNATIKSQPRLFLGSNHNQATNMLALAAASANQNHETDSPISRSSNKTDTPDLLSKRETEQSKCTQHKVLRPSLSKLELITSLEFSEALPFAAFASMLLEMVVRIDGVIKQVEELGRVAQFKEFKSDIEIVVGGDKAQPEQPREYLPPVLGSAE